MADHIDSSRWRQLFVNRRVGVVFLLLLIGFAVSVVIFNSPYLWPFVDFGRRTAILLGCYTLGCFPLYWGLGILYSYLFAVLVNAVRISVTAG